METDQSTTFSPRANMNAEPRKLVARRAIVAMVVTAVAATIVNVALWGIGSWAGADLVVDTGLDAFGGRHEEVGIVKVIWTTPLALALGTAFLVPAVWLSGRWVDVVVIVGGVLGVASAAGPLGGAHDSTAGVVLAIMHLTTTAAFVIAARKAKPQRPVPSGAHR